MIEKIRKLRKQGHSYSEIGGIIKKSRKFAWRVARDIKFSNEGKKRYLQEVKGIIKQIKPQKTYLTVPKVRIIGHVLFDGTAYISGYHYVIRYINTSMELINQFTEDVKKVYGISPSAFEIIKSENLPCYKVAFYSKLLFQDLEKYFKSYSTKNVSKIPDEIMNTNRKIKMTFLQTFWEDEGSITSNGRLMADQKSDEIIKQIIKLHKEFGLNFQLCKYKDYTGFIYKIYLLKNKENLKKFYRLKLFDKAIVTHGKNTGRKKLGILKEFIKK